MTPEQIQAASAALQGAVTNSTNAATTQVADAAAAKAPGLAVGANTYDVGRYVTPNAQAAADQLVVAAKQQMVKKALTDAQYTAEQNYTTANENYQTRQRKYYRDLAIAAAERQRQQDAAVAAATAAQNGVATSDNAVDAGSNTAHFIGKNDFRGVLNYNASKGDANAKLALKYVGNDGKFSLDPNDPKNKAALAALKSIGATNVFKAPKPAAQVYNPAKPSPFITSLTSGGLKNPLFR